MKGIYTIIFLLCMGMAAQGQDMVLQTPKLSPLTRMLLRDMSKQGNEGNIPAGYIHRKLNGKTYVSGLIKVTDTKNVAVKLEDMGVITGTKAGNIWSVQVPYEKVPAFTQLTGISYIQLDEPLRPAMNEARKATRVDSVHMGVGLPWPMTGLGVVMGIIDFGFDYNHPTCYDTLGVNYRVKQVWELNTTGTPPSGYSYGHEITGKSAIIAQGTDNNAQTHGTGVAGIASGSGYGTVNGKLRGVAYHSDMVFVGVRRDSIGNQWMQSSFTDFIDGVNYIFSYANSVSKPAVVNISWGSQSGPHDGTSLFAQACDNLSGQGKIIVMSAGNDGQENIHLDKTFTSTDTVVNTFITFSDDTLKRTWIDIWGDTSKTFCANITLYKNGVAGNSTGYICIDDQLHQMYLIGDNGLDTCFIDFITSSSEFNNKPRMTLNIYNKAVDSIHLSVKSNDGAIDMWNEYYYYGYTHSYSSVFESLGVTGAVNGNTSSTVSDMGSAKSVLLVGAYVSKRNWVDINGNPWQYSVTTGALAPFSSHGPMADGRVKPDITAPGMTLGTSISSFDTRYTPTGLNKQQVVSSYNFGGTNYYYAEFSGTSASAPVTSGIVALMLQAHPKLTPQQTRDIIIQTAIKDSHTGTIPSGGSNIWGFGKINAAGAVRAAHQANSIYEFKGDKLDCVLFPNPNNGSFTLNYTGDKNEKLTLSVYDISGRVTLSDSWVVTPGDNTKAIDITKLSAGTYVVSVSSGTGSVSIKMEVK